MATMRMKAGVSSPKPTVVSLGDDGNSFTGRDRRAQIEIGVPEN
ncbi:MULTISPECIES: hypothetical protein [unclassified Mesorhizobium]|nr:MULTISPECIES: hypothetical protein [unclassified Mesorhizobium]